MRKIKINVSIKKRLNKIFIAFFLFFFFAFCRNAFAEKISLGLYPPLIKIKTSPGSNIKNNITITNYTDTTETVSIYIKPFTSSYKNNGEITFVPETNEIKNFFSDNVKIFDGNVPINQLLLSPKQKKSLEIHITIPKTAKENDYYIGILFVSNNIESAKSNISFISQGIGMNVLLSILQQPQQDLGYIKTFATPVFIKNNQVPFTLALANQGNHFFTTQGTITINNLLLPSKDIIQLQQTNVLANSSRYISSQNNPSSEISWHPHFLFGIYKAEVTLNVDRNNLVFHKTIYFYSYPGISLVALLFASIFLGIVIFKIRKK